MTEEEEREVVMKHTRQSIFVFGSNLAGIHGAGAAAYASRYKGAVYGHGVGPTGSAYAIPTKDERIETMPLKDIEPHIKNFIVYARVNPDLTFVVTRVGCGLAGYSDAEIAPMFKGVPGNCIMPVEWHQFI